MAKQYMKPARRTQGKPVFGSVGGGRSKKSRQPSPQMQKLQAYRSKPYTELQEMAYEECGCDELYGKGTKPTKQVDSFQARYQRLARSPKGGYKPEFICPVHRILRSSNGTCIECDAAETKTPFPTCPIAHSPMRQPRPRPKPKPRRKPRIKKKKPRAVVVAGANAPRRERRQVTYPQRTFRTKATNGQ